MKSSDLSMKRTKLYLFGRISYKKTMAVTVRSGSPVPVKPRNAHIGLSRVSSISLWRLSSRHISVSYHELPNS